MKSEPATFGIGCMFPASAEGFAAAMDAEYRVMESRTIDWPWEQSLNLREWTTSRTLWLRGFGRLGCNIQRDFITAGPMLFDYVQDWRLHFDGINILGDSNNDEFPLLDFSFVDRSTFQNGGIYAGPRGMQLGSLGAGYASQINFHNYEWHRCLKEGLVLLNARKIVFSGLNSGERNGLADPAQYPSIRFVGTQGSNERGQSWITGLYLEHDDERHIGLLVRNGLALHVGANRHMLAGYDIETSSSTRYRSTVYGSNTITRFVGNDNVVPLIRNSFGLVHEAADLRLPRP